jgi:hypothetical protein
MTRPAGVTAIAVLYIIGACFMVLVALGLIIGGSLAGGALGSMIGGSQSTSGTGAAGGVAVGLFLGAAGGIIMLIFAAAHGVVAWGMLKLKEWARIVSIALAVLGLVLAVPALLFGVMRGSPVALVFTLVRVAIAGWILWYLVQPHVKAAFRGGSALPVQV